jgi:hypothetical protein
VSRLPPPQPQSHSFLGLWRAGVCGGGGWELWGYDLDFFGGQKYYPMCPNSAKIQQNPVRSWLSATAQKECGADIILRRRRRRSYLYGRRRANPQGAVCSFTNSAHGNEKHETQALYESPVAPYLSLSLGSLCTTRRCTMAYLVLH